MVGIHPHEERAAVRVPESHAATVGISTPASMADVAKASRKSWCVSSSTPSSSQARARDFLASPTAKTLPLGSTCGAPSTATLAAFWQPTWSFSRNVLAAGISET
jgi:hypothetical protein